MSIQATFVKTLKEIVRNRPRLLILILSPIVFFSFFGFIFNSDGNDAIFRNIAVINDDEGTGFNSLPLLYTNQETYDDMASLYLDYLDNRTDDLVDADVFINVYYYSSLDEAIKDVETQVMNLLVVFPENFTESVVSAYNVLQLQSNDTTVSPVVSYGDQSTSAYQVTFSVFSESLNSFVEPFIGYTSLYNTPPAGGYTSFEIEDVEVEQVSQFQFFIAGFFVFIVLLQMISVAGILGAESMNKTIERIKMSYIRPSQYFTGILLAQFVAFTLQFFLSVAVISMWGISLSVSGWANVYLILQLTNMVISAASILIAALVKGSQDTITVTGILTAPLGFLSGSFLPVPEVFVIKSLDIQIWDIIPTYHANEAMIKIFVEGLALGDVVSELLAIIVYMVVLFVFGIIAYNRRILAAE